MPTKNITIFDKPLFEQIGLRLRSARKTAGFKTAKAFASAHHIPYSTYAQYETGKRSIPVDTLIQYSQLLSIDPLWLLMGKKSSSNSVHHNDCVEGSERVGLQPIRQSIALVDIALLTKIFKSMMILFVDGEVKLSDSGLIVDCYIDMYNVLVTTSGSESELDVILGLLVSSLKRRLEENIGSGVDEKQDETA